MDTSQHSESSGAGNGGDSSKRNGKSNAPTRRNKSMRACDECRKRKVKCDGVQPCSRCRRSEIECVFAKLPPKRGPPKQYIELLEARLQLVEKALQSIDGPARQILDNALLGSPPLPPREGSSDQTVVKQEGEEGPSAMTAATAAASTMTASSATNDPFAVNEIGQAMYVNDIPERIDRVPSLHSRRSSYAKQQSPYNEAGGGSQADSDMETDAKTTLVEQQDVSIAAGGALPHDVPLALVETYFAHVHKFAPMIHHSLFYKQIGTGADKEGGASALLLYAMCAVASRWTTSECSSGSSNNNNASSPHLSNSVPGFSYYQRAFAKMEEFLDAPRLSTVQALVLLIKYQEYYKRFGFFRRPAIYLEMAAKMCNDLGLPRMDPTPRPGEDAQEHQAKKRTFWTVFMYDLMMSIEQGREPYFSNADCTTGYPAATSEEVGTWLEEVVSSNNTLIQLSRTLSEIHATVRRLSVRQEAQGEQRSERQLVEEQGKLFLLHTHLESFVHDLPGALSYAPTTQIVMPRCYPAEKQPIGSAFAAFLHMTLHLSVILLHRHYLLHPLPTSSDMMEPYQHRQLCAWAASNITAIAETLHETQPVDVFSYPTRGVQHTIHCLTTAATVHHYEMSSPDTAIADTARQQYSRTHTILSRLAGESPAVEFQSHIKEQEAELAQLYGRMAVDPARAPSSVAAASTDALVAPATPMPQQHQDPSDASSTSSSPVMSSPARGIRRHTLTGTGSSHLMQMAMLDNGTTTLFNSSAAFSDPTRYASLMMRGGGAAAATTTTTTTPGMPLYNHHQQPLPVQRKSRLRHPMSYSQEDLRSLRRAHMTKPLGGGSSNWPAAHARGSPIPPDFVYPVGSDHDNSLQPPRFARQLRRQSSMTAMMPSYYAQLQQQQQQLHHALPLRRPPPPSAAAALPPQPTSSSLQRPIPGVATAGTGAVAAHHHPRRHTISIPSDPPGASIGPAYTAIMTAPIDPQPAMPQQQQTFMSLHSPDTIMSLDTTTHDYAYSSAAHHHYPLTSMSMDPISTSSGMMALDTSTMEELMMMGSQWPLMADPAAATTSAFDHPTTTPAGFEDMQRSEGHVM